MGIESYELPKTSVLKSLNSSKVLQPIATLRKKSLPPNSILPTLKGQKVRQSMSILRQKKPNARNNQGLHARNASDAQLKGIYNTASEVMISSQQGNSSDIPMIRHNRRSSDALKMPSSMATNALIKAL